MRRRLHILLAIPLLLIATMASNCVEQIQVTLGARDGATDHGSGSDAPLPERPATDGDRDGARAPDRRSSPDLATGDTSSLGDLAAIADTRTEGGGTTDRRDGDAAGPDRLADAHTGGDLLRDVVPGSSDLTTVGYHPRGWPSPTAHGRAALDGVEDCRSCHGSDLTGFGAAPSCDLCHAPGWRSDCTFCHGGDQDSSGAPPPDLGGGSNPALLGVGSHGAHVSGDGHRAYGCAQCHRAVLDVLTPGHMFDSTPADVEVLFGAGLSPAGSYAPPGCSDLYCHGDGRDLGAVEAFTGTINGCDGCHPDWSSPIDRWQAMSGEHNLHLQLGYRCHTCHGAVIDSGYTMVGPQLHVNGQADVAIGGGNYDGTSCSTSCHLRRPWESSSGVDGGSDDGGGGYHAAGWSRAPAHGRAFVDGALDCRLCHGDALDGRGDVRGCDGCHRSDWRDDCTFCHGGLDNGTGAPPSDLHGNQDPATTTVGAHTAHVAGRHPAYPCSACHRPVPQLLAPDHFLDPTPGTAEVDFSHGVRPGGSYSTPGCSAIYCHGSGLAPGDVSSFSGNIEGCTSCHPTQDSPGRSWFEMSGKHAAHLQRGYTCSRCHATVVDHFNNLVGPELHVNGSADTAFGYGSYDGESCLDTCHLGSRSWGAPGDPDAGVDRYHAEGWWDPLQHGPAAIDGPEDCRACHGAELTGEGSTPGCDTCHPAGWRTACTFCHGGLDNSIGAPPADVHGATATSTVTVGAHSSHVSGVRHRAYGCTECHHQVVSVTTPGHMFDSVPGADEVDFATGLGAGGAYAAPGCTALYCHGDGRSPGDVPDFTGSIDSCAGCHPFADSSQDAFEGMGGEHGLHLDAEGITCHNCHGNLLDPSNALVDPALHVDGEVDVLLEHGVHGEYRPDSKTCSIMCHGKIHSWRAWEPR